MATITSAASVESHPVSQRLGHPVLTTADAIAQSLAIGPIFSAAVVGALVARGAGASAPLATLCGALGAMGLGWVVTLYARRYVGAGAIYDYMRLAISPTFGLFSAGIYFIGSLFLAGTGLYLAIGLIGASALGTLLGVAVPWWVIAVPMLLFVFMLNHIGVKVNTRAQLVLTSLSSLPVLLVAVAIIAQGGAGGNTLQVFNPANTTPSALFSGIFFAVTMFIGFEAAASLGEETANPRRSIPRAVFGTVLISSAFYLLVMYASAIGFGTDNAAAWASDPMPIGTLATRYVGGWLAPLVDVAVMIDLLAIASAFMATSARGWFALARHGLLPAPLARTSRFHTPLGGNLLVLVAALLPIVAVAIREIDPFIGFLIAGTAGSLLIEVIYIGLVVVAAHLLRREPGRWWHWPMLLVAIATPVLGIYGTIASLEEWPTNIGVYSAVAAIAVAAIWTLVVLFVYPQRLAAGFLSDATDEG